MAPPGAVSAIPNITKNHSAEAHRQDKRGRRDLLVQCAVCGAKATCRKQGSRVLFSSLRVIDGKASAINKATTAWQRAEEKFHRTGHAGDDRLAKIALGRLHDARRAAPSWLHAGCGGALVVA